MGDIYFSSDFHFSHQRDFIYVARGFKSVEEHDAAILENINQTLKSQDTLYVLGDLIMGEQDKSIEYLKQIHCQDIKIIIGNHDSKKKLELYSTLPNLEILGYSYPIKVGKKIIFLSHYPTVTTNWSDEKNLWQRVVNLCGHTHTFEKTDPITGSFHVELDAWNNKPVSYEEIIEYIRREKYDF